MDEIDLRSDVCLGTLQSYKLQLLWITVVTIGIYA